MIVTVSGASGLTNAYRSVLISGASRCEGMRHRPFGGKTGEGRRGGARRDWYVVDAHQYEGRSRCGSTDFGAFVNSLSSPRPADPDERQAAGNAHEDDQRRGDDLLAQRDPVLVAGPA